MGSFSINILLAFNLFAIDDIDTLWQSVEVVDLASDLPAIQVEHVKRLDTILNVHRSLHVEGILSDGLLGSTRDFSILLTSGIGSRSYHSDTSGMVSSALISSV